MTNVQSDKENGSNMKAKVGQFHPGNVFKPFPTGSKTVRDVTRLGTVPKPRHS